VATVRGRAADQGRRTPEQPACGQPIAPAANATRAASGSTTVITDVRSQHAPQARRETARTKGVDSCCSPARGTPNRAKPCSATTPSPAAPPLRRTTPVTRRPPPYPAQQHRVARRARFTGLVATVPPPTNQLSPSPAEVGSSARRMTPKAPYNGIHGGSKIVEPCTADAVRVRFGPPPDRHVGSDSPRNSDPRKIICNEAVGVLWGRPRVKASRLAALEPRGRAWEPNRSPELGHLRCVTEPAC